MLTNDDFNNKNVSERILPNDRSIFAKSLFNTKRVEKKSLLRCSSMLTSNNNTPRTSVAEPINSTDKVATFRQTPLYSENSRMREDENQSAQANRQFREEDTISMCSESSMLFSSYDQRMMRANVNSEPSYPSQWSIEDVGKWLNEIALQAYVENFRRHDIDGSILIDETDGINDDIIRQLIPSLGTQLKFKKALRALRNNSKTPQRPDSAAFVARQESEEIQKLQLMIQRQAEQISSLIATVNSQAKQIEQLLVKLATAVVTPKATIIDAFSKSSSIVQNQLLDLPSNISKIPLATENTPLNAIPAIDPLAPSVLPIPVGSHIPTSSVSVPTSVEGPQGSSGVSFPAVVHPKIDGIAIKPVIDDVYNFQNYGRYAVTIYDQQSENVLVQTLVNVVPENEICMPKKFVLRDSLNNILVGATLRIKLNGNVLFTGTTDHTGTINIPNNLPKNCYDVEIMGREDQHKPSIFRMIVYENRGVETNTQFICRQLDSDQVEIVLKWGLTPRDLDSHVFVSDGRHVYYESKVGGNVSLDCDVTNGNGPETVRIRLEPNLKYLYVVHRYSRDGPLVKSGATVTFNNGAVQNSSTPYQVVQIPVVNQFDANFWVVCEIDGTTKQIRMLENAFENHNNYASDQIAKKYFQL